MTPGDKELLLKDLCARLPYGVKVNNEIQGDFKIYGICENFVFGRNEVCHIDFDIENIKPYLFPLTSMDESQKYDFYCRFIKNDCNFDDFKKFYLYNGMWRYKLFTSLDDIEAIIDWFRKNHIDYRGFIPMGLAIDATGLNVY